MSQTDLPADRRYTASHEWARPEGEALVVGITAFAAEQLTDITFVELPAEGAAVAAGRSFGEIESVKSAGELYSPVSGEVVAVNEALQNDPGLINRDSFGEGWILKVAPSDPAEYERLMDAAAYAEHLKNA